MYLILLRIESILIMLKEIKVEWLCGAYIFLNLPLSAATG